MWGIFSAGHYNLLTTGCGKSGITLSTSCTLQAEFVDVIYSPPKEIINVVLKRKWWVATFFIISA
jgi:hypothetical protein